MSNRQILVEIEREKLTLQQAININAPIYFDITYRCINREHRYWRYVKGRKCIGCVKGQNKKCKNKKLPIYEKRKEVDAALFEAKLKKELNNEWDFD